MDSPIRGGCGRGVKATVFVQRDSESGRGLEGIAERERFAKDFVVQDRPSESVGIGIIQQR